MSKKEVILWALLALFILAVFAWVVIVPQIAAQRACVTAGYDGGSEVNGGVLCYVTDKNYFKSADAVKPLGDE